jgi:coenzyme Q-binding protein COQ10
MIRCSIERAFPYPIAPLFAVVADIEAYPLYMPGWGAARVLERSAARLHVEQIVGVSGLRITFVSVAEIDPPHRLAIRSSRPPFRYFRLLWQFSARSAEQTLVRAEIDMAFRSRALERVAARLMPFMMNRVVEAFRRRVRHCLGGDGGNDRRNVGLSGRPTAPF